MTQSDDAATNPHHDTCPNCGAPWSVKYPDEQYVDPENLEVDPMVYAADVLAEQ